MKNISHAFIHIVLFIYVFGLVGQAAVEEMDIPQWVLKGELGKRPQRMTADYPLSDQSNKGGWQKYELMSDEFEADKLDEQKWYAHNPGWKGRQPAFFSEGNVQVSEGKLHLTMRKEEPPENLKDKGYHTYSSAAVQSKTRVLYGYFEIKAKPMRSHGSSAFWFYDIAPELWTEIDVFEIGGGVPDWKKKYNMNLHVFKTPQEKKHWSKPGGWISPDDWADDYHVYGLEWNEEKLTWYVDGVPVRWTKNTNWHQPLTMNFDSETMPDWFGLPRDEDLPSVFSIEYVRAWKKQPAQSKSLFTDRKFQQGFLLMYPRSSQGRKTEAVLNFGDSALKPVWYLAQWGTKYTLAGAECQKFPNGDRVYENAGKKVLVGGPNSENRDLILAISGKQEYGDKVRKSGESWPHLLIEQDANNIYPLTRLNELNFHVLLKLRDFQDHMNPKDFDTHLHASQFQMFLVVRNIDKQSKDYMNYFWFGVPFFDSRRDIPKAYQARDSGKQDATGKFIFTIDGRAVNYQPMKTKKWITFQKNLLNDIKEGLIAAGKRGYFSDTDPAHYAVVNMNLGWEITGTYDAAIQIRDLDICAVLK